MMQARAKTTWDRDYEEARRLRMGAPPRSSLVESKRRETPRCSAASARRCPQHVVAVDSEQHQGHEPGAATPTPPAETAARHMSELDLAARAK